MARDRDGKSEIVILRKSEVPGVFKMTSDPGQVPSKGRMRRLGEIRALQQLGARDSEGIRSLTLGNLAGRPVVHRMAGGKDPFEMPDNSIVDPIQLRGPIHHPRQVTDGIPGIGDQWGRELDRMVFQAPNEVSFRQRVVAELQASGIEPAARRELFERAIRRYRTVKGDTLKSREPNSMEKALFIGPRGGRWADAAHTVPYDPEKHGPKHKQVTVRDKTGGEGKPSEALISLPQWISERAARYIARELGLSGREKVERLETQREAMKAANKVWRRVIKKIPIPENSEADRVAELSAERREALAEGLAKEGFDDQEIQRVLAAQINVFKFSPGSNLNSPPFAKYELTNLGAKIRTAKKRAEQMEAEGIRRAQAEAEGGAGESEAPEYKTKRGETFTIEENLDANRVQLHFEGKPSAETRRVLKTSGFRWSPREGAWQRMLNAAGRGAAESVRAQLVPPETPEAHPIEDHPAMPPEDTQREAVDLSSGIWPEGTNPEPELLPPDTLGRRKHGKWTKPVALGDLAAAVAMVPVGSGFHTRRSDSEALDEGQYYLRISPNQWAEYYGNEGARRGLMKEVLTDALVAQRLAETKYVRGFERQGEPEQAEQPQQESLFRSETGMIEILTVDDLRKAVYVGPRGGKWMDPQHKIPLRELRDQPGAQQRAKRRLDAPGKLKVARREAREAGARVKAALKSGTAKELQSALRGLAAAQEHQVAALRAGDQDSKADRVAKRVEAVRGALWTIRGEAFGSGRELDPGKRKRVRKKLAGMLKAGLAAGGPQLLLKAEPRGGKYHRRIPKPSGGYRYIYDPDKYGQREDAHVKGSEANRAYVGKRVAQVVDRAGSKGVEPAALKSLVKRHGAKRVAQALRDRAQDGTLAVKKGKFYPKRKAGEEDKGGE